MESSNQSDRPPVLAFSVRMADTPRPVDPPVRVHKRSGKLKKSTYYGILLYLVTEFAESLSPEQRAWIVHYSRKLSIAELLKAENFSSKLRTEEQTLKRTQNEIERIRTRIPRLENLTTPEPNRIGIGYRDKGALRPLHERREFGEISYWDEDVRIFLPYDQEIVGKWITASEVSCLVGEDLLELIARQLQEHKHPLL